MWIKHNHALYNCDDISKIWVCRTKLKAKFNDGTEEIIGEFRATKESEDIFSSVTRNLLSDEKLMMIRDTKVAKEKK